MLKENVMEINENSFENALTTVKKIEDQVSSRIVGQKELIRQTIISILAGGNILLESVPGLGKTSLVKTFGKALELKFSRIQFTPDLMPADVCGTNIIARTEQEDGVYKFQPGPIFSNIVLADEINRATPKTQSALLEAMQEQTVTVGNTTYELPQPFFVMATQNPIEMEGTYPLPEAQMDRFLFKLKIPFPSLTELTDIVKLTTTTVVDTVEAVTSGVEIMEIREIIKEIPVAANVMQFAMRLILATHPEEDVAPEMVKKYVRFGASPRGAQALIAAARVRAVLEGRYNVSFEDVKQMAYPALRHRIFLNYEGATDGINTDGIIRGIIQEVSESMRITHG